MELGLEKNPSIHSPGFTHQKTLGDTVANKHSS